MFVRVRFASWSFAVLIAAGCASPAALPASDSAASLRGMQFAAANSPTCAKPFEFVLDSAAGTVTMYSQSKKCGQMSYGFVQAQGIAVDANENLYVVDTGSSNVFVFKPPYTGKPFKTYKDPNEYPVGVAVCKGYVAVTNIFSTTGGAGSVTIYRDGKASVVSDP